jgi:hypothetical protein
MRITVGLSVNIVVVAMFAAACGQVRQNMLQCSSPDGSHIATFYREYGGGAAGSQYEYVSVRKRSSDGEVVVLELKRGYDSILTWLSPMHLEITYPDTARVDHWQSWFAFESSGNELREGTTTLRTLHSKDGSFIGDKARCGT